MSRKFRPVFCGLLIASLTAGVALATTQTPRTAVNFDNARASGTQAATTSSRTKQPVVMQRGSVRSTRNIATRAATTPNRSTVSTVNRAARLIGDASTTILRHALGLPRSAVNQKTSVRSATAPVARVAVSGGASRARATAVFSDISKLGTGYTTCRDTYNTCMDQFCAGANETYRRCFCSNSFRTLRDKEDALDAATTMLANFEDNNLNAVNKTAEEVNAMYSATEGEAAIKKDTSASAALLDEIGDLLSGKKKASDTGLMTSVSGWTIEFSNDLGDIWATNNSNSLFGSGETDLSTLEGIELYNQAHNQCMQLVGQSCENGAVRNMVKSAYNILITQDCNAYQKKLDTKTEQVKQTVRTAEKYLREARLDEYRSHNSADVNECMDKVETAILQPTACGTDFVKCLDYTGVYINTSTGDPIYSERLFGLGEIIQLDGSADVLTQNAEFNKFLDSKRMYAKTALDTCRDIADTVWNEFKRNALIKISQAQDEKLEEVKMSCVNTMKECYDTQSGALKSFDNTNSQASGALAARAARDMCSDKVNACAALYRKPNQPTCQIDKKTNLIKNPEDCGLKSLLNFVHTVDETRISEGCSAAIESYLKQLCTPTSGTEGYPWNCRLSEYGDINGINWSSRTNGKDLVSMVTDYALGVCGDGTGVSETNVQNAIKKQLEDLKENISIVLAEKCEEIDGVWTSEAVTNANLLRAFYANIFGGSTTGGNDFGRCYENTTMLQCISYNADGAKDGDMARYDASRDECIFTDKWYEQQCAFLGNGYFENGVCYVAQ